MQPSNSMTEKRGKAQRRGGPRHAALRAARAYTDINADLWAHELGSARSTIARYEAGGAIPDRILERAAELSGLPLAFLLGDVSALQPPAQSDLADRLADIQRQLDELRRAA